jgi:hypothetical protein
MIDVKKEKTGSMKPMPPFKTLEEEAEYWDTHSPFDDRASRRLLQFTEARRQKRSLSGSIHKTLPTSGKKQTNEV